jgi:(heptosyl)LPS beta-1,4-glucosyltransferase
VIILTRNEEQVIRRCLQSVTWADEIIVLDSESTDATREIAADCGATVHVQPWLGWASQRLKATDLASNDWVFFVDADEVVSGDLAHAIIGITQGEMDPRNVYSVDRRGDFLGVLLRNSSRRRRKRELVRLFNRRFSRYDSEQLVHESVIFPGQSTELPGVLLHWSGRSIDEYVVAFNHYATIEAEELDALGVKSTWVSICLRPIARFGWLYIWKQGFRLGVRGFIHASLKGAFEFIRYSKLWEKQNISQEVSDPSDHVMVEFGGISEHTPITHRTIEVDDDIR